MRLSLSLLCVGVLLLTSWFAAASASASARYSGQCGGLQSFKNGTNYKVRYAVVTTRRRDCRRARATMRSYLDRMGRYARAGKCSGARCTNASPRGWSCALTSYAARRRGRLADCRRGRVKAQAKVWPPVNRS